MTANERKRPVGDDLIGLGLALGVLEPRPPRHRRRTMHARTLGAVAAATGLLAALVWAHPATETGQETATTAGGTDTQTLPPKIPSHSQAQDKLDGLDVQPKGPQDGYDRSLFPHWNTVDSPCTARQVVLERDGQDVAADEDCQPVDGRWWSAFDDEWVEGDPADIDVDHLVPLSEAYKTGAADWSTAERADFANDVESPQLW